MKGHGLSSLPYWFLFWILFMGGVARSGEALQFSEEFNEPVDPADWIIENRPGGAQGTEKPELQYYLPEALRESAGVLHLTVRKVENSPLYGGSIHYSSGRIQSRRSFLYGRFAFRVRLPHGKGLWSAIGLRTAPKLPLSAEIDVLQGYGSCPNVIESGLHAWTSATDSRQYSAFLVVRPEPDSPRFHREGVDRVDKLINFPRDLSEDFHIYSLDWQPDRVTWSLDGVPYFSSRTHVPKDPMVIIIRLAVGGAGDGKPDATTLLPQALDLDYVRVWTPGL